MDIKVRSFALNAEAHMASMAFYMHEWTLTACATSGRDTADEQNPGGIITV